MATIKSYTDISQSKKLAEILSVESADMYYTLSEDESINIIYLGKPQGFFGKTQVAWSLAALLAVLPKGNNISTPKPINEIGYCCWNQYNETYASNPVDACYEMILRLHELKML